MQICVLKNMPNKRSSSTPLCDLELLPQKLPREPEEYPSRSKKTAVRVDNTACVVNMGSMEVASLDESTRLQTWIVELLHFGGLG